MSAGDFFELIRPAAVVLSALLSTWLLVSARKRLPLYQALPLSIASFFLPFVILPLYLALLVFCRRQKLKPTTWRLMIPLLFLTTILTIAGLYTYFDARTVDAHLARASMAKAHSNPLAAIPEYRAALRLEDNPHTHKLLAQTLDDTGFFIEAITEFQTAQFRGERDDLIHLRLAGLFERINHNGQAILEFKEFAASETCLQIDYRCEAARQRIADAERSSQTR